MTRAETIVNGTALNRIQCTPNELWFPGRRLDSEYPIPSDYELRTLWQENISLAHEVISTKGVLGVAVPPTREVAAIVSVDLCEVVRTTQAALYTATGVTRSETSYYADGTWFDGKSAGRDVSYERSVLDSVINVLLHADLVEPVENADKIATFLRKWRQSGIFVIANTSTLEGTEPPTIRNTLGRDLQRQFDGLILPRNHRGIGGESKATALRATMEELGISPDETPVVHIDDSNDHMMRFNELRGHFKDLLLVAPRYHLRPVPGADLETETSLEAFKATDAYFKQLGVVS